MAHPAQQDFCRKVKALLPGFFSQVQVVDFGSLDINGSNRELFSVMDYTGVDIYPGKNVDVLMRAQHYRPSRAPDVVISTEMLEHDREWAQSLRNMYEILRPGGLMLTTCATTGRGEHGTLVASPGDSPGTLDYYRNLTEDDFKSVLKPEWFSSYCYEVNHSSKDLYFWGIKSVDLSDLLAAQAA